MYKLIDTKPIHPSYALIKPFGKYDDGEYAEFSIDVEVNNELIGHVLQMGVGLEVLLQFAFVTFLRNEFKIWLLYTKTKMKMVPKYKELLFSKSLLGYA